MSKKGIFVLVTIGTGIVVIVGAFIGIRVYYRGNLSKARRIAANLEASALAHPNPVVSATTTPSTAAHAAAPSAHSASSAVGTTGHSATGHSSSTSAAGASRSGATSAVTPSSASSLASGSSPRAVSGTSTGATSTSKKGSTTTRAPRTQPTAVEVQEAISAVHTLVPFYTPSAADIASAGNDVCTALDNGATVSQVQSVALNMIGAGSYASFIPSADTTIAIQTLVALYCPGYTTRVA